MSSSFVVVATLVVLFSFFLSMGRLLNCLIVVENFNVLILFSSVWGQWAETHMFFLALMVIFTVEVVLALVVLTRLWDSSALIGTVGW